MNSDPLIVESVQDDILTITINRPNKRNALSWDTIKALTAVLISRQDDEELRAVILRGAGTKSFAAGGDLAELDKLRSESDGIKFLQMGCKMTNAVRSLPVPVIACLNGDALGGGAELAISCDVIVSAPWARVGFVQSSLNLCTGWGGGPELISRLGVGPATIHLAEARPLSAEKALSIGLIDGVLDCSGDDDSGALDSALDAWMKPFKRYSPYVARANKLVSSAAKGSFSIPKEGSPEMITFLRTWMDPNHWLASEAIMKKWS